MNHTPYIPSKTPGIYALPLFQLSTSTPELLESVYLFFYHEENPQLVLALATRSFLALIE